MIDLIALPARALAAKIAAREASAVDVVGAFLARIEAVNGSVNAIVTLDAEGALAQARAQDEARARGEALGPLAGLPIAVKDLAEVKGMRTTFGSPLFKDHVPNFDQLFVTRMRGAGAIIMGKTNTPEFGAGSHTFNPVFGATNNPYNLTRSAGGSSGGAAAALACDMQPLADGSDFGGSLRNPASFCNMVGFRPSPGRVPSFPNQRLYDPLAVVGPMARTVDDAALLLSVMAGPDKRDPLSLPEAGASFDVSLERDFKGARIAWSPDLGHLPVEQAVRTTLSNSLKAFDDMGCVLEQAQPDLKDAEEIFLALRSVLFVARFEPYLDQLDELVKDTIAWNTREGLKLSHGYLGNAKTAWSNLYQRALKFFETYDYLVLPAAQVAPFPVEWDWVHEIEGVKFDNYLQWMQVCCAITLTGLPAISVPGGFTEDGLPVGLQIVGRLHDDLGVLQIAHAFEQATQFGQRKPDLPGV